MKGPLLGLRVIELAGIGPAPMATMLLADLGADVVRVEAPERGAVYPVDPALALNNRGKRRVVLDLKQAGAVQTLLELVARADVLVEAYRPGVAERLGLGPDVCQARNPRLIYGRVTGWGQEGVLASVAGHDLNYIALSGALAAIGPPEQPAIPLNLLGDFAGGSLYLVMGVLSALFERQSSGRGQVIDAAMVDGVASLMTSLFAQKAAGQWRAERESNLLDGGAPFYALYQTADQCWVSVAAIEGKFFANLLEAMGLAPEWAAQQYDRQTWPALRAALAERFAQGTRAQWCERLGPLDVCFAPVLTMDEAPMHAHHRGRGTYSDVGGVIQPAVAPRFDRTPPGPPRAVPRETVPIEQVLHAWPHP